MPEYSPPQNRGNQRLEERVHRLEEKAHQLSNEASLANYKHTELEKKHAEMERDFQESQRQTAEKFKWNMGLLMTFIGSVVLPAIAIIVTLLSKGDASP